MQKFLNLMGLAWEAYSKNVKLVSLAVVPFLIAFPLAAVLPNYAALGALFLRMDSLRWDMTLLDSALIVVLPLVSMLFFSFAMVAINMVVTHQRTMNRITHYEFEKIEQKTFQLFEVYLFAFTASFIINFVLYQYGLHSTLGALLTAAIAIVVLFAPQSIVIDGMSGYHSVKKSMDTAIRGFPHTILFLALSAIFVLVNDFLFIQVAGMPGYFSFARFGAVVVNSLLILPFLEVLKIQLYLSKYTLL